MLLWAVLLTLGAAPAGNRFERKPAGTSVTLQNPHDRATASELIDRSCVPTGSMGTARELHTATLLSSGKVLAAGGDRCSWARGPSRWGTLSGRLSAARSGSAPRPCPSPRRPPSSSAIRP